MAHSPSNIERFLGRTASHGGPFALLGIPTVDPDPGVVVAALEARLNEVNVHMHSETPQADEVRLALHAGAAQLLDPAVRRHMVQRWGSGSAPSQQPSSIPVASGQMHALERDAILTLGMFGGWNRRSLRRIALLAHARGVPSHRVADAIRAIAHRRTPASIEPEKAHRNTPPARSHPVPDSNGTVPVARAIVPSKVSRRAPQIESMVDPMSESEDADDGNIKLVLGITLGILIVAISLLGVLTILWPSESDPSVNPPPEIAQSETQRSTVQKDSAPPMVDPMASQAAASKRLSIPDSLDRARDALAIDPDLAVREIVAIIARLEIEWPSLALDERTRLHADLIDLLYLASARADRAATLTDRIAEGARAFSTARPPGSDDLYRGAWSSGMLVRLSRESNLPVSAMGIIDAVLADTYAGGRPPQDATFEHGATDFLSRAPSAMLQWDADHADDPQAVWDAWQEALLAVGDTPKATNSLLLAGLDQILRDGPEVNRREWALGVVEKIVGALAWDQGSGTRRWLLTAFNAPALTSADLFAVTAALSRRRGLEGLDPTMALDAQASERARGELRDRYAAAWGMLNDSQSDGMADDLRSALVSAMRESSTALTQEEHLAATARLAMLNQASAFAWRGDFERAQATLDKIDQTIRDATRSTRAGSRGLSDRDSGQWALRYLSVRRNQQARIDLLDALARRSISTPLDAMDSEVLVGEAVRGDRSAVRRKAQELTRQFLSQAPIVNALLESLPDAPETRANARLFSDAAGIRTLDPTDPSWRIDARRGLVERLLELLAGESPEASIDRLSALIADAYLNRASLSPLDESSDAGLSAQTAANELRLRWRSRATNVLSTAALSLDRIERARSARVSSARGPVQIFAAQQLATCELMAYVVIGEQAGISQEVLALLATMESERQGARHVFAQLASVEATMAQFWAIRMRE